MAEVASFGESKSANRERTVMVAAVMSNTLQLRSHKGPNFSVCLVFFIQSLLYDPKVLGEVVMIIILEKRSTKSDSILRILKTELILVGGGRHGKVFDLWS